MPAEGNAAAVEKEEEQDPCAQVIAEVDSNPAMAVVYKAPAKQTLVMNAPELGPAGKRAGAARAGQERAQPADSPERSGTVTTGDEPLFAIYGSQDVWGKYVSVQFFSLWRTLFNTYGWRIFESKKALPTSWPDFHAQLVDRFGRVPDVLLFVEDFGSLAAWGPVPRSLFPTMHV
jgi:hypothetical protein